MQNLPDSLRDIVGSCRMEQVTVGLSSDGVYRLHGEAVSYLKIGSDLKGECERLRWLEGRLPAPRVLHYVVEGDLHYLLMSNVPGEMVHEVDLPNATLVRLLAEGARMWHSLPVDECPFDWRLDAQIAKGFDNAALGLVDEDDFDDVRSDYTALDVFDEVEQTRPDSEDLVVVHGDYCLPNILVDRVTEKVMGFVDVGRMGVADRWLDLALGYRSTWYNFDDLQWAELFIKEYGVAMDQEKREFYMLIDELF
jgi:aminoglycoside 3'-phosphotransferase II